MAVTFAEETLRALQNAFSIYEAILAEYATVITVPRFDSACYNPHWQKSGDMVEGLLGRFSLAGMSSIRYKTGLEVIVLV